MSDNSTIKTADTDKAASMPLFSLLALAASCFIVILTETLPAGLLLPITRDLQITEAMTGQLVTAYALGSLVAAIPLSVATRTWDRRPLLIMAITFFAVTNFITAVSYHYTLTIAVRFLAGLSAGLLWSIVPGYASRLAAPELKGRAIAIAMVGTPLALSLGLPASTYLGQHMGWRAVFILMSVLGILLIIAIRLKMPNLKGQDTKKTFKLSKVFLLQGMPAILLTLTTFILAHNILYTYIGPVSEPSGLSENLSSVLLVFGISSLISIFVIGIFVDRYLRALTLSSIILFLSGVIIIGLWIKEPSAIYFAVAVWGLGYGGSATLFQTATAQTAGQDIDVAQAMTVVAWNLAISAAGILGGLLLHFGAISLPYATIPLLIIALITVFRARKHGFK